MQFKLCIYSCIFAIFAPDFIYTITICTPQIRHSKKKKKLKKSPTTQKRKKEKSKKLKKNKSLRGR